MPRIKTDSLQAGMLLTGDVKNLDNMLLLPAGTALNERQIGILQAWGVTEVEVGPTEGSAGGLGSLEKLSPDVAARLRADVRALFWQLDESCPIQGEVFKLALQRRADKHLAGEGQSNP